MTVFKKMREMYGGRLSIAKFWWQFISVYFFLNFLDWITFHTEYPLLLNTEKVLNFDFKVFSQITLTTRFGNTWLPVLLLCCITFCYCACIFWEMSLLVRRFHDMNFSGWWAILLSLTGVFPFIIGIVFLLFRPGCKRKNDYGPPSK